MRCTPLRERQGRCAVSSGNGPAAPLDPPSTTRIPREGDEWRGPFATESTTRKGQIMREIGTTIGAGIAIIGMTSAAQQLLTAAATMRTDEYAAIEQLRDAIECANQALRAATGNRSVAM